MSGLCTLSWQETGGFWSNLETGVTVSAGRGATSDIGDAVSVPWSLRLASVRANSQWGLEGNLEYGGRRTVNGAHFREFGIPVTLVRRTGRGSGPRGISGTYGVFRPEFVALRDWGATRDNLYYSGVMRFSARVGVSFSFP